MIRTESAEGPFRISKAGPVRPRREHPTFEAAEAEAHRLSRVNPNDTFIIAREVARVCPCDARGQAG